MSKAIVRAVSSIGILVAAIAISVGIGSTPAQAYSNTAHTKMTTPAVGPEWG
jgi:hypothetical protein